MHVGYGGFGVSLVDVEDVCCAAVRIILSIYRHVQVSDWTILSEDLLKMLLVDSLG